MVAIDDLQWADRTSLRFVAYLVRRVEGLPILIAATLRSGEAAADPALLEEIVADPLTTTVSLQALSGAAVAELVRARLGDEAEAAFCAACHEATGGNPLLLGQLLSALAAEAVTPTAANAVAVQRLGPRAVSRTVLMRLARLPEDVQRVARAVAVLGDGADVPAVAALAGLEAESVAGASGALARAEILRPDAPLAFVHALVRDAVYLDVAPGERQLQHGRAARLLREAGAAADRVAAQLAEAPCAGAPWVVETLREAARSAQRRGAPESAVVYLRRALDEPPAADERGAVLLELGLVETDTSAPAAAGHLEAALADLTEPRARATAAFALARVLLFAGEPVRSADVARRAAAALPSGPEFADQHAAFRALELQSAQFGAGEPSGAAHSGRPAGDGPGALMLAATEAFWDALQARPAGACAQTALRALAGDALLRADNGLFWVPALLVLELADHPEADRQWERARLIAHERGSPFAVLSSDVWRGAMLRRRGELAEAEEALRAGIEAMHLYGSVGPAIGFVIAFRAGVMLARGDTAGARRVLHGVDPPSGASAAANFLRRAWVGVLVREGRLDEALTMSEEGECHGRHVRNPAWVAWRSVKAEVLAQLGRGDGAVALAAEELALARQWDAPVTVGRTLRVLGSLPGAEPEAKLREAVALLEGSPARLELANALTALGVVLRRERRPREAREPLRRALELADSRGAAPLAYRARSELYAAGGRPRAAVLGGVEALSAQERRVGALEGDGLSNRDIAQQLYVTPKTVELHLRNAYRKLGIASRRELPHALVERDHSGARPQG
jgi:DNA-binding NarL/FixJ family response regulator